MTVTLVSETPQDHLTPKTTGLLCRGQITKSLVFFPLDNLEHLAGEAVSGLGFDDVVDKIKQFRQLAQKSKNVLLTFEKLKPFYSTTWGCPKTKMRTY